MTEEGNEEYMQALAKERTAEIDAWMRRAMPFPANVIQVQMVIDYDDGTHGSIQAVIESAGWTKPVRWWERIFLRKGRR